MNTAGELEEMVEALVQCIDRLDSAHDAVPLFVELVALAHEAGPIDLALDMATLGMRDAEMRMMADRWRESEFYPEGWAGAVDRLVAKLGQLG
jgi:hypothetical protein